MMLRRRVVRLRCSLMVLRCLLVCFLRHRYSSLILACAVNAVDRVPRRNLPPEPSATQTGHYAPQSNDVQRRSTKFISAFISTRLQPSVFPASLA
jgi:hypothetical protein